MRPTNPARRAQAEMRRQSLLLRAASDANPPGTGSESGLVGTTFEDGSWGSYGLVGITPLGTPFRCKAGNADGS